MPHYCNAVMWQLSTLRAYRRVYTPKKVVVQLSVFMQKGKVRRVSQGVYEKV